MKRIFLTDKNEEIKLEVVKIYKDKQYLLQEVLVSAYIKNKNKVFYHYTDLVGNLTAIFYPRMSNYSKEVHSLNKNDYSRDLELKKINESDYENIPYSYLGMINVAESARQKGIGSAMLQLQDYLLAKYASKVCDENAKSAVRGWFVPMLESDRKSTEMFYRKNNVEFVEGYWDLLREFTAKEILADPKYEKFEELKIKEYRDFEK